MEDSEGLTQARPAIDAHKCYERKAPEKKVMGSPASLLLTAALNPSCMTSGVSVPPTRFTRFYLRGSGAINVRTRARTGENRRTDYSL